MNRKHVISIALCITVVALANVFVLARQGRLFAPKWTPASNDIPVAAAQQLSSVALPIPSWLPTGVTAAAAKQPMSGVAFAQVTFTQDGVKVMEIQSTSEHQDWQFDPTWTRRQLAIRGTPAQYYRAGDSGVLLWQKGDTQYSLSHTTYHTFSDEELVRIAGSL